MSDAGFQPMPPLTDDEYDALKADIAERGIVVPVVVDQHGRLLDGHHRQRIAAELGIDCPSEIRHVEDDDQAHETALVLNVARRHLTREQRRQLIATEIERRPDDADRAIARRCGCDHKTVGSVRRELSGEIPHPDDRPYGPLFAEFGSPDPMCLNLREGLAWVEWLRVGAQLFGIAGRIALPFEDGTVEDLDPVSRLWFIVAALDDPRGETERRFAELCREPKERVAPNGQLTTEAQAVDAAMKARWRGFCSVNVQTRITDDTIRWWVGDFYLYEKRHKQQWIKQAEEVAR